VTSGAHKASSFDPSSRDTNPNTSLSYTTLNIGILRPRLCRLDWSVERQASLRESTAILSFTSAKMVDYEVPSRWGSATCRKRVLRFGCAYLADFLISPSCTVVNTLLYGDPVNTCVCLGLALKWIRDNPSRMPTDYFIRTLHTHMFCRRNHLDKTRPAQPNAARLENNTAHNDDLTNLHLQRGSHGILETHAAKENLKPARDFA
jgi:hypothetical protein